ncbi:MAG: ABC transporter permease [Candidatus Caenarcaniphilales bacterium]|nr:ABC transporter permease [Candidatus Caenarcaniphilales bacterium]
MINLSHQRIFAILKKEFLQLLRDITTLRIMIMIPILQLLLFGFAINSDPKNMPTVVLSKENSNITRSIVSSMITSKYFEISQDINSVKEANFLLKQREIIFIVNIPKNFTRDLLRGDKPKLLIEADATDPIAIAGPLAAIKTILNRAIEKELQGVTDLKSNNPNNFELRIHRKYNPEGFSRYNIVPGLIAIVLTVTGVMMTALSLTREKERSTMENLLAMPVKPLEVMIGKVLPYIIIGYIQASIIIATAHFLFTVPIMGNLLLLGFGLLIFLLCNLALGFTLSAGAQSQMQAMQMSFFLMLPSILLSGFMFPFLGMPKWAQVLGSLLPSTYFIRIVRGIMLKGANFYEILPNIYPLFIFLIVITFIAMKIYKKTLD